MRNIIFYIVLFFYLLGPVAFFFAKISTDYNLGLTWLEEHLSLYEATQRYFLSTILGLGSLSFGIAFYRNGVFQYRLSEISGICGIIIALTSLCLVPFWSIFSWIFMLAGFLCLYSVLVPIVTFLYKKMEGNSWEKGAVTAFVSFLILYFVSYQSNILISNIFEVDPKHFPFTHVIAGIVVLAPFVFLLSLILLICFICVLMRTKEGKGERSFLSLNGMIASMFLFIFSLAFVGGGSSIIKNVASVVDFNPSSICENAKKSLGVIYLDNRYELILINEKQQNKHIYELAKCEIGISEG